MVCLHSTDLPTVLAGKLLPFFLWNTGLDTLFYSTPPKPLPHLPPDTAENFGNKSFLICKTAVEEKDSSP